MFKTRVVIYGSVLERHLGIVLQKRKISQTFSIRLLPIRARIAHYVDVVAISLISKRECCQKIQRAGKWQMGM